MYFIVVTVEKDENLKKIWQNEDKHLIFHLHNTPTYLKVYTNFENTRSNRSREISLERKKNEQIQGTDKQYGVFVTQYNSSLSSFVPNFRFLSQVVAEKSLTEIFPHRRHCIVVLEQDTFILA